MMDIPLPEPAFGRLCVNEDTGRWIESRRTGESAFDADQMHAYARAYAAAEVAKERERTKPLIEECRAALAEELAAYEIDPPLHHVLQAHNHCAEWLAAAIRAGSAKS